MYLNIFNYSVQSSGVSVTVFCFNYLNMYQVSLTPLPPPNNTFLSPRFRLRH